MIINKNKLKQLFGIMSLLIVESNWTIVFSNTNPPMNSIAPMCATFLYKKKKKKRITWQTSPSLLFVDQLSLCWIKDFVFLREVR